MHGFIQSVIDYFTKESIQPNTSYAEHLLNNKIIKAVNQCGEDRYIIYPINPRNERREQLEVLLNKCKKLLSFVSTRRVLKQYYEQLMDLSEKVHEALTMENDVSQLFDQYERLDQCIKRSSKSFKNLSSAAQL